MRYGDKVYYKTFGFKDGKVIDVKVPAIVKGTNGNAVSILYYDKTLCAKCFKPVGRSSLTPRIEYDESVDS